MPEAEITPEPTPTATQPQAYVAQDEQTAQQQAQQQAQDEPLKKLVAGAQPSQYEQVTENHAPWEQAYLRPNSTQYVKNEDVQLDWFSSHGPTVFQGRLYTAPNQYYEIAPSYQQGTRNASGQDVASPFYQQSARDAINSQYTPQYNQYGTEILQPGMIPIPGVTYDFGSGTAVYGMRGDVKAFTGGGTTYNPATWSPAVQGDRDTAEKIATLVGGTGGSIDPNLLATAQAQGFVGVNLNNGQTVRYDSKGNPVFSDTASGQLIYGGTPVVFNAGTPTIVNNTPVPGSGGAYFTGEVAEMKDIASIGNERIYQQQIVEQFGPIGPIGVSSYNPTVTYFGNYVPKAPSAIDAGNGVPAPFMSTAGSTPTPPPSVIDQAFGFLKSTAPSSSSAAYKADTSSDNGFLNSVGAGAGVVTGFFANVGNAIPAPLKGGLVGTVAYGYGSAGGIGTFAPEMVFGDFLATAESAALANPIGLGIAATAGIVYFGETYKPNVSQQEFNTMQAGMPTVTSTNPLLDTPMEPIDKWAPIFAIPSVAAATAEGATSGTITFVGDTFNVASGLLGAGAGGVGGLFASGREQTTSELYEDVPQTNLPAGFVLPKISDTPDMAQYSAPGAGITETIYAPGAGIGILAGLPGAGNEGLVKTGSQQLVTPDEIPTYDLTSAATTTTPEVTTPVETIVIPPVVIEGYGVVTTPDTSKPIFDLTPTPTTTTKQVYETFTDPWTGRTMGRFVDVTTSTGGTQTYAQKLASADFTTSTGTSAASGTSSFVAPALTPVSLFGAGGVVAAASAAASRYATPQDNVAGIAFPNANPSRNVNVNSNPNNFNNPRNFDYNNQTVSKPSHPKTDFKLFDLPKFPSGGPGGGGGRRKGANRFREVFGMDIRNTFAPVAMGDPFSVGKAAPKKARKKRTKK